MGGVVARSNTNILLTGGIASGKSFVSDYLASLGAVVVDTDQLARTLTVPDNDRGYATLTAIRAQFGDTIVDGGLQLDRAALRERIFTDQDAKKWLEGLMHPQILQMTKEAISPPLKEGYYLTVVPLLHEGSEYLTLADRVLVVEVDEREQLRRLMARDGISQALAERMIAAQISRLERRQFADDIIINHNRAGTIQRLQLLHNNYLKGQS